MPCDQDASSDREDWQPVLFGKAKILGRQPRGRRGQLMTSYKILLHTDKGVRIHDKGIECKPAEIPEMLACVVMDYLKGSPYPGAMKAHVISGRRYTEYILLLENDALNVYRHVEKATRVEVQGNPPHPPDPPAFQGKKDASR